MTTVAVKFDKKGVATIAADSRVTVESESGGIRMFQCEKLYRKHVTVNGAEQDVIIGVAGEGFPALVFVDWYGSGSPPPDNLLLGEADFTAIVLSKDGLFEYDKWCRGEKVLNKEYAIGSGAKAAMGALYAGKSAAKAVEIACRIDPMSGLPVTTMQLPKATRKKTPRMSKADKMALDVALGIRGGA